MVEVQAHGFSFEKWVRDTHFDGYRGNYMQKWDVAPEAACGPSVPRELRGLPVSIKTAKYGCPIGLGDVLRQRQIDSEFVMIVGFWRQRSASEKWFEEIGVSHFTPADWDLLWGSLTLEQLREIDRTIKDVTLPYSIARQRARDWKRSTAGVASAQLIINPKIDSKTQRRIQCSMPFPTFWRIAGRTPTPQDAPTLFGVPFPNPIHSRARTFNL
jgi:hypothetical protein